MDSQIITQAKIRLDRLSKQYKNFITVMLDNWRGYCFIYDTVDVRRCQNKCSQCPLYNLLKKEPKGLFSAGLLQATQEEKDLFGPQNYLNCKTYEQYIECYSNYFNNNIYSKKEFIKEKYLLENMKVMYSQKGKTADIEKQFKSRVLKKILKIQSRYV